MKKFISFIAALLLGAGMLFAQNTYTKITSAADLEDGAKYLVVATEQGTALGIISSNNKYRMSVSVTISSGVVSSEVGVEGKPFEITLKKDGSNWNLYDAVAEQYISQTSGKNEIPNADEAYAWSISFDEEGNALIGAIADADSRRMQCNANEGQERFSAYKGTQKEVQLYKAGGEYVDEDAPEVDMVITSVSNPRLITVQFNENIQDVAEVLLSDNTEGAETVKYEIDSTRVQGKQLLIYAGRDMIAGNEYTVIADEVMDLAGNETRLEEDFFFGYQGVADIAEIMAMRDAVEADEVGAQKFLIRGDVVITAMFGKNIYIQDKDCADVKGHSICLYDAKQDAVSGTVQVGTVVNGVIGELTIYNGLYEMNYIEPGCVQGTETVEPVAGEATIYDVLNDNQYHSALVKFKNVEFTDAGGEFEVKKTYGVEDEDNSINLYTQTDAEADFIGMEIPSGKGTVIGYITTYNSVSQICPRTAADIFPKEEDDPSHGEANERNQAVRFSVYPNPASDVLHLDVEASDYTVSLYNLSGIEMARTGRNAKQVDLRGLAKGMYLVAVKTVNGVSYAKVIVR